MILRWNTRIKARFGSYGEPNITIEYRPAHLINVSKFLKLAVLEYRACEIGKNLARPVSGTIRMYANLCQSEQTETSFMRSRDQRWDL